MKDMNDEKIQEMLEKNAAAALSPKDDEDVKTYSLVFDALSQQPEIPLSFNFSAKVTARLQAKKHQAGDLRLYVFIIVGFLLFMLAAFLYLNNMNSGTTSQLIMSLLKYKWILLFGAVAFGIIQFLDRKLIETV